MRLPLQRDRKSIDAWVAAFEKDYFELRGKTHKTETTWEKDYWAAYKMLNGSKLLKLSHPVEVAKTSKPNTKTRKRLCRAYRLLLDFAGQEGGDELQGISGSYSRAQAKDVEIPSDSEIQQYWDAMPTGGWEIVYGLMCCCGLRPSEPFFTNLLYVDSDEIEVVDSKQNREADAKQ